MNYEPEILGEDEDDVMTAPLLIAWRADATLWCSECGTLAEGIAGRDSRPLEVRHYLHHGYQPRALAEERIEASPWPGPADWKVEKA